ncbi:sialidase family protein [Humisphaera borealis]|uniref:Exo-alpha-sialidase n=1 Tax=Humisphaera borealis TaxID=2807512 RepID=A0A7M2X431_9BACT|nr:sialidase family protein [Humisphaera borealis]QOV91791.1 exo-alpha-sialidase [Humisphaera borealis]
MRTARPNSPRPIRCCAAAPFWAAALLVMVLLASALASTAQAVAAVDAPAVKTLRVPDRGIFPQAAIDSRGRLHLMYVKGDPMAADAYYVRSDDGGATFTKPIRVNSGPESVIVTGTVRGPHLSVGRGDRIHVAWMGSSKAEPKSGKLAPMLYTRLNDAGDAFEPQRNVGAGHPGLDGGGSVAADADGNVYVAWHAPAHPGKSEGEEGRQVWISRSQDDGKTFAPETAANPQPNGVCACCGMRIYCGDKGRVLILYRSASQAIHRDIQMLVSDDHGKSFQVAVADPWQVATCVMSTAACTSVAADGGRSLAAAWETTGQIRVALLTAGATKPTVMMSVPGDGKSRKHPSVAANSRGQILVAWAEGTGWNKGGTLAWQLFDAAGKPIAGESGQAPGIPVWSVPSAVALPDGSFRVIY